MALTKVSTGVVDMSGNTGALEIAKGTTTERDAISSPTLGLLRSNTTDNTMEVYTNNSGTPGWQVLKEGGKAIIIPLTVEYLVVAGGGAGGGTGQAGGGGAGGLRTNYSGTSLALSTGGSGYTVTVGSGGVGTGSGTSGSGGNSVFYNITSAGGGGGGTHNVAGADGGSGGGGGTYSGTGGSCLLYTSDAADE